MLLLISNLLSGYHYGIVLNYCVLLMQIVSSAIIDKYIGESARLIREMFNYARQPQVWLIMFCFFIYLVIINILSIIWKLLKS